MGQAGVCIDFAGVLWQTVRRFRRNGLSSDCLPGSKQNEKDKKMPKLKTKKCATKRFKMSATGKVLRSQGGKSHLNGYKPRSRKRNLRGTVTADDSVVKTIHRMMPY